MIPIMKKIYFIFGLLVLGLASCEHAFMNNDAQDDPVSVFDYLWNKVDQQYAFFDVKGVDWDSVREVYRPMVYDGMSNDSLFRVCAAMLNTLQDGHTNLMSSFDVSRNDSVYYRMVVHKNVNSEVVVMNYLTLNYHSTGAFAHNAIRNGEVAYVRYSSFSETVTEAEMDYLVNRYKDCKGIIFDMRQNGGGSIDNIRQILSIFDNHGQPLYKTQIKSGPKHDEFTEQITVYAPERDTTSDKEPYTKPVAVLIDRGSYSATSFFSVCTQAYPNIRLFGDYSGGGLGLPNGGALPNGWIYRFSITRTLDMEGNNYENGVPPQERVLLDPACTAQGIDNVIEAAADWIVR